MRVSEAAKQVNYSKEDGEEEDTEVYRFIEVKRGCKGKESQYNDTHIRLFIIYYGLLNFQLLNQRLEGFLIYQKQQYQN